jgi:hypothetical protein
VVMLSVLFLRLVEAVEQYQCFALLEQPVV